MQALGRVLASGTSPAPFDDYWFTSRGTELDGMVVTTETAMTIPAFYAGTTAISEDMAKVAFGVYEDLGPSGNRPAPNHPVHRIIHTRPNEHQTAFELREMLVAFAILRGLGIAEIRPGARGAVGSLVPLHPDLVTEETTNSGTRRYRYRDPLRGGSDRILLSDEVWVVPGRFRRSIISFAMSQAVLDVGMERSARFLFSRGSRHQGVLTHPKTLSPDARINLKAKLNEYEIGGPRAGRPMLLEEGMTWTSVSLTSQEAEFLESRRFNLSQWARFFRIPAHKLQDLTRSTNNNIEEQGIDYVTDGLLGWTARIEQSADMALLADPYFSKLNLAWLMRGNLQARYTAYALGVQWGWVTRNEVRRLEDMNPIDGLDAPLTPLNMTTGGRRAGDPQAVTGYLKLLASDAAARVVRRETAAITKLVERGSGPDDVAAFYDTHTAHVAQALHIPEHAARAYTDHQQLLLARGGDTAMSDWLTARVEALTDLAIEYHQPEALEAIA